LIYEYQAKTVAGGLVATTPVITDKAKTNPLNKEVAFSMG
jgi:hypothetical protein